MPTLIRVTVGMTCWLVASGCGRYDLTEQECQQMLEHYVMLQQRRVWPRVPERQMERTIRDTVNTAREQQRFQHCQQDVSRTQWNCATQAWDPDALERCLVPIL